MYYREYILPTGEIKAHSSNMRSIRHSSHNTKINKSQVHYSTWNHCRKVDCFQLESTAVLQRFRSKVLCEILTVSSSAQRYTQSNSSRSMPDTLTCDWHFWMQGNLKASRKQRACLIEKSLCDDVSTTGASNLSIHTREDVHSPVEYWC